MNFNIAIFAKDTVAIKFLLAEGKIPDQSLIFFAIINKCAEIIKLILEYKITITADVVTCIIKMDHFKILKDIIDTGRSELNSLYLNEAVRNCKHDITNLLLKKRVKHTSYVMTIPIVNNDFKMAKILIDHGIKFDAYAINTVIAIGS